ncbi:hypothetical protein GCM10010387_44170 [Streptomyces inusitatus]|uniref:SnoaL-like domain-containing protein n=1 Tax=Streptomyces inusitatus TaxID=68221 RepID=A0A918UZE3_9ACTN|nr:nuclear transport factor 2 family protein [Streptomyces inusitatus]GGZ44933.1 hypothetical protein GCM10010387_44170 [Streptomyces inusitatus]
MSRRIRPMLVLVTAAALLPLGAGTASASASPAEPRLCPPPASALAGAVGEAGKADRRTAPLPPNVVAFIKKYCAWGEKTSVVKNYMDLFTSDGTLMDTGLPQPIGRTVIKEQIEGVLKVMPDYVFEPVSVTSSPDGGVIFVKARNTGTVKQLQGPAVSVDYYTMHRLVLRGDEVEQGRRFWDQTELFRPLDQTLPNLFAGLGSGGAAGRAAGGAAVGKRSTGLPGTAEWKERRKQAWNSGDVSALVPDVRNLRLNGPGLKGPITGAAGAEEYLGRFFGAMRGQLKLEPGNTVRKGRTVHQEWVGHATVGPDDENGNPTTPREVTYGIVERFTHDGRGGTEWELSFETLDLVATQSRIAKLRERIFPPKKIS